MRVDFYQLTRDPAEKVLPLIAARVIGAGGKLLVVAPSRMHAALSSALWAGPAEGFLAHGAAGEGDETLQPILLSDDVDPLNGAANLLIADGEWREAPDGTAFDRIFYLFPPEQTDAARAAWRLLGTRESVERHYWKQDGGRWREGP